MAEINDALAEISDKVDDLQADLEALADTVVSNALAEAHTESEEEANEILQEATLIADFELLGIDRTQPNRHGVINGMVTKTRDAMMDLGPTLLTQAGTGSAPALLALERNTVPVSDTEAAGSAPLRGSIGAERSPPKAS